MPWFLVGLFLDDSVTPPPPHHHHRHTHTHTLPPLQWNRKVSASPFRHEWFPSHHPGCNVQQMSPVRWGRIYSLLWCYAISSLPRKPTACSHLSAVTQEAPADRTSLTWHSRCKPCKHALESMQAVTNVHSGRSQYIILPSHKQTAAFI